MHQQKKALVIRMSSLGDVLLTEPAVKTLLANSYNVTWIIAESFAWLRKTSLDPELSKIHTIVFDRKQPHKLRRWIQLFWTLGKDYDYDLIFDFQKSLRSQLAKYVFSVSRFINSRNFKKNTMVDPFSKWFVLSKPRFRRALYIVFKQFLPETLRPQRYSDRCRELVTTGLFRHSDAENTNVDQKDFSVFAPKPGLSLGVVPSSAWRGKQWSIESYFELIRRWISQNHEKVLVFGVRGDRAFEQLQFKMREHKEMLEHIEFVHETSRIELEKQILRCGHVLGGDTGLLHLAESLGVSVTMLFGPTRNDFGFGVRLPISRAIEGKVWCSPCSKDGSLCFRFDKKYACMKSISVEPVLQSIQGLLRKS